MRIVRFRAGGKIRYGVLEGTHILEYAGTPYGTFKKARKKYLLSQAVLLAPVVPSKIVAVGLNYRDHADEMNVQVPTEPPIFLKPVSALCGPDDPIVFPPQSRLGYTCLNDVTARDLHTRDGHPTRAKGFDSFCPVGPCIATDIDPNGVDLETYVNGERRQASNTKYLIYPVEDLVARISAIMTLLPGDIIATGTPGGTGPLRPGDKVEVRIESIGSLKNPVIKIQETRA